MHFKRGQNISKALDVGITANIKETLDKLWELNCNPPPSRNSLANKVPMYKLSKGLYDHWITIQGYNASRAKNLRILFEKSGAMDYLKNKFFMQDHNRYTRNCRYRLYIKKEYIKYFPVFVKKR